MQLFYAGLSLLEGAGYLFDGCIECFPVPGDVFGILLYLLLDVFLELLDLLVDLRLALEALIFKLLLKAPGHFRQLNIFDVLDLRLYQVELSRVVLVALLAAV